MVDIAAIAGVASSLKAATEITKAMIGLRDASMIQAKVIELQSLILAAQSDAFAAHSEQLSLLERVRETERKMAQLEAWEAEKKRYKLTDYGGGTFAYELKPDAAEGEPIHRLCASCYKKGHASILQFSHNGANSQAYYDCTECKKAYCFGIPVRQPARTIKTDYF